MEYRENSIALSLAQRNCFEFELDPTSIQSKFVRIWRLSSKLDQSWIKFSNPNLIRFGFGCSNIPSESGPLTSLPKTLSTSLLTDSSHSAKRFIFGPYGNEIVLTKVTHFGYIPFERKYSMLYSWPLKTYSYLGVQSSYNSWKTEEPPRTFISFKLLGESKKLMPYLKVVWCNGFKDDSWHFIMSFFQQPLPSCWTFLSFSMHANNASQHTEKIMSFCYLQ